MSRCFPFPPPGYEKKSTTDVGDLPKKEKDRERKHKKDKKDREKRDGKGKKDKDRSDGKNRDKKDKKEKRRENKERDKDEDITDAAYEKKVNLQLEHNENNDRITDEKKHLGKSDGGHGESFIQKGKENDAVRKSITVDKNLSMRISGHNRDQFARNNHFSALPEDATDIQYLGQKNKDGDRGTRSLLDGKFSGDVKRNEGVFKFVPKSGTGESKENIMRDCGNNLGGQRLGGETKVAGNAMTDSRAGFDLKRDEGMSRVVTKATDTFDENKEKNMKVGNTRLSDQGFGGELMFTRNYISENLPGKTQTRIGHTKPLEEVSLKRIEGKERTKQKESDHKHDKDYEKKGKRKNQDRDRDWKKEEKSKNKNEPKIAETNKLNKSIKNDLTATSNVQPSPIRKASTQAAVAAEGDPRKWKDLEQNGFLGGANESEPVKLARPPPQPVIENGRMLKACPYSVFSPPGLQGALDNVTVGNKEHAKNGFIGAPALSTPATRSFSVSLSNPELPPSEVDQRAEVSQKPPHPDTKYLHEILSVPKVEEWSTFDDQEWLFQENEPRPKKSKVCSYDADETPQVWAETLRIDSADIYALPYVIPY